MNIGIFTDTYYPEVNGVANSTYQLKSELEKLGHNVYIFTVTNPDVNEAEENVFRIRSLPFVLMKDRRMSVTPAKKWLKVVNSLNLDIIHSQTEFLVGHTGRKIAHILGIPIVHTYHTIYEDYTHYLKIPGNTKLKSLIRSFSRACCDQADIVVVPTMKIEKLIKKYGVKKEIVVQPTGIDIKKFADTDKEYISLLQKKYDLDKSDNILVSIGRLSKEKNVDEIVRFFPNILKKDIKAKLLIVGDGPEMKSLRELVKELDIREKVIFTGQVDWDKIQNYYALGDIFVSASTSETQGLTYIEALAAGKPLLVRRDECLDGVLCEAENGFFYETKEEFCESYERLFNSERLDIMEKMAYISSKKMSLDSFGLGIENVYRKVVWSGNAIPVNQVVG